MIIIISVIICYDDIQGNMQPDGIATYQDVTMSQFIQQSIVTAS